MQAPTLLILKDGDVEVHTGIGEVRSFITKAV